MIKIVDVQANYGGAPVLNGVSLAVGDGEIVALLGRNGVGKSTLLKTIIGLVPVRDGRIEFQGRDIGRLPAHTRAKLGIAYVPQGRLIFPRLSVLDNLRVGALACQGDDSYIADLLDEFPILKDRLNVLGGRLSGGQQQILAIARAMATNPRLLLLDEPTEGVQPTIIDEIVEQLRAINARHTTAILLVEQRLSIAEQLASRAYIMNKGLIVKELSIQALVNDKDLQHELMSI